MDEKLMQAHLRPLLPLPTRLKPDGHLRRPVRAVLYDIYGTLLISGSGDIGVSRRQTVRGTALEDLLERFRIRMPADQLIARLHHAIEERQDELRRGGIDWPEVEIDQMWGRILGNMDRGRIRRFAFEYELIVNPVYPMPHLFDLLKTCREQSLSTGIISNAQFYTVDILEWFLGADLATIGFQERLLFLSYRHGCAKPSPVMFEKAADALARTAIEPGAVLYVGNDMLNDIHPARNAGFQTALYAGDRRSLRLREDDPRCKHLTADLIVTDLKQLADQLAG